MLIKRQRGWDQPGRDITPEAMFFGRRAAMSAAATAGAAAGMGVFGIRAAAAADAPPPGVPASAMRFNPGRPLTAEKVAETYNNYYEFSDGQGFLANRRRPSTSALVDRFRRHDREAVHHRHRRPAEAGAARGAGLSPPLRRGLGDDGALDRLSAREAGGARQAARPRSSSCSQTREDPKVDARAGRAFYPWPYIEGLTMAEASERPRLHRHRPLRQADAAAEWRPDPAGRALEIRLQVGQGDREGSFTDKQPRPSGQAIQPDEYGFWANVNPAVPHPRWSQAQERLLGTDEIVPTQIYNGYGEWVSSLYAGMPQTRKLFM